MQVPGSEWKNETEETDGELVNERRGHERGREDSEFKTRQRGRPEQILERCACWYKLPVVPIFIGTSVIVQLPNTYAWCV